MGFWDTLFGGKKKQKTSSSGSTTYDKSVLDAGSNILMGGQQAAMAGQGLVNDAGSYYRNNIANARSGVNRLAGSLEGSPYDMASASPYINFFQQAAQPALGEIDTTIANNINTNNARARYGLGGYRNQLANLQAAGEGARQKGHILSQASQAGINFGAQQHQQNIANRMNAFGQFAGLGNTGAVGAMNASRVPLQNQALLAQILASTPKNVYTSGTQTATEKSGGNVFGQLLGAGATVVGGLGAGGFFG